MTRDTLNKPFKGIINEFNALKLILGMLYPKTTKYAKKYFIRAKKCLTIKTI